MVQLQLPNERGVPEATRVALRVHRHRGDQGIFKLRLKGRRARVWIQWLEVRAQ